jgi:hypothetical protein
MTKQDKNSDMPELESLVGHYRETRAPLGFAARLAAHVEQEHRTPWWSGAIAAVIGSPILVVATSLGVIALLSILIVQMQIKPEPDLQIARQDKIQQPVPHKEHKEQKVQKPAGKKEIDPAFYQPATNGGYANLAALSDVSGWLDEETESSATEVPDMTDIPDLGDIEAAFDTT